MSEALVPRLKAARRKEFYLEPFNEGHEIPYAERLEGTPFDALVRAREMVEGLSKVLPRGSYWDYVTVNDIGVWDKDWNEIAGSGI